VNVTTVYMGTNDTAFRVRSYLGVDPSSWQTFPIDNAFVVLSSRPSYTTHQTYVEHIPGSSQPILNFNYVWFSDRDIPIFPVSSTLYASSILFDGPFAGNNYLYSF